MSAGTGREDAAERYAQGREGALLACKKPSYCGVKLIFLRFYACLKADIVMKSTPLSAAGPLTFGKNNKISKLKQVTINE